MTWAKEGEERVYWLSGQAGSGKSTIAYTIARRFELAAPDDVTILGANFFCSRHYEETRFATRIIRTIAYQLGLKYKPFADALIEVDQFEAATQSVQTQISSLLVRPWRKVIQSTAGESPRQQHLIVIDALDEIEDGQGADFLRHLLPMIAENDLDGLKFLVTSRPEPNLGENIASLESKKVFRLQDVAPEDARADIEVYLNINLSSLVGQVHLKKLADLSDGLFIYAATIVHHLRRRQLRQQIIFLGKLFAFETSTLPDDNASILEATGNLDQLYHQLLSEAFQGFRKGGSEYTARLRVLHTFICANEPISTDCVAGLLFDGLDQPVAYDVVECLHAVLYTQDGKVFSYHKSFPDFIVHKARSQEFWCHMPTHHRLLTECCLRTMSTKLKFNMAEIPSSYVLDRHNPELEDNIKQNISPNLRYACLNWTYHLQLLSPSGPQAPDPDSVCRLLSEFLELPALFWMEAMNLFGMSVSGALMLDTAGKFVQRVNTLAHIVNCLC